MDFSVEREANFKKRKIDNETQFTQSIMYYHMTHVNTCIERAIAVFEDPFSFQSPVTFLSNIYLQMKDLTTVIRDPSLIQPQVHACLSHSNIS